MDIINYLTKIKLFDIATVLMSTIFFVAFQVAYSVELDENDYIIRNFGINNTNPFITVEGIAGRSYDVSMGDEGYVAYVFDTDKGVYQVTVSYTSTGNPGYSASRILSNISAVGDCLITVKTNGTPNFYGQTVEYVDSDIEFTKVKGAHAIVVSLDDPDDECISGEHIRKVISTSTNPTQATIQN